MQHRHGYIYVLIACWCYACSSLTTKEKLALNEQLPELSRGIAYLMGCDSAILQKCKTWSVLFDNKA